MNSLCLRHKTWYVVEIILCGLVDVRALIMSLSFLMLLTFFIVMRKPSKNGFIIHEAKMCFVNWDLQFNYRVYKTPGEKCYI